MKEERIDVCYERRFIMVDYEAVMSGGLKAHEIAVYVVLCAFASNSNRSCYPSYTTLAEKAGCSRSTVIRTIAVLADKGYIEKISQIGEEKNHKSNLYVIKSKPNYVGRDTKCNDKQQVEVVSAGNHTDILEPSAAVARESLVSPENHSFDPQAPVVVSEGNGGGVRESHELYSLNYNKRLEEDEEEGLKRQIEYDYYCREMPKRVGFVDTLLQTILALERENKPDQCRLLDKVDSCVILDFMDEYKGKQIDHVQNYSAWLKTVFLQYLHKREAFQKDFW